MREEDSIAVGGIWIAAYLHKYASLPPQGMPTYRRIEASMVNADALKGIFWTSAGHIPSKQRVSPFLCSLYCTLKLSKLHQLVRGGSTL